MESGLDKIVGPFFFYSFERFGNIGSDRPITTPQCRLKEETVFEEFELVAQMKIQV
jgi:hypothetical protein